MTMKIFRVEYDNAPSRSYAFKVRGLCEYDILNPCWDNRPSDVPGEHWGGSVACDACRKAALETMPRGCAL